MNRSTSFNTSVSCAKILLQIAAVAAVLGLISFGLAQLAPSIAPLVAYRHGLLWLLACSIVLLVPTWSACVWIKLVEAKDRAARYFAFYLLSSFFILEYMLFQAAGRSWEDGVMRVARIMLIFIFGAIAYACLTVSACIPQQAQS